MVRVVKRYADANGGTYAVNIAWNTLFAFFPIILLISTTLTAIFGGGDIGNAIDQNIERVIPGDPGTEIVQALHSFHQATGPLLALSILGLLWSGTALFGALEQGSNALYPAKPRSFVRQKLMGVVLIVVFTVLVALEVGSASALSFVTSLPNAPGFVRSTESASLIQAGFGLLDGLLLFGAIFVLVPNRRRRIRDVWPGALIAALLLEGFTLLFPLYFRLQHGFTTYGSTFALFFLLLTFAFWVAQITMLGGAVNVELHPPETPARAPL
ncbi:MAG: YihY/virulence factor BrkB family protein [Candidatus Dormibacteraeota bacterium]|nr:YihY/virulence factor BrkB family protein [Candidatus Dormibacteraeota bacterium]